MHLSPSLQSLPVLVISPYSRCNCRCVMCDIWRGAEVKAITSAELHRHLASVREWNVQKVVFSGGEPLMHPEIFKLCAIARKMGARVTILSTGLLLKRYAAQIVQEVDDVIVSLDGPERVHDRIRRVAGGYQALMDGIDSLRQRDPNFQVSARCTVQRLNCGALTDTVAEARRAGLCSISFLAADVHTTAFNRAEQLTLLRESEIVVGIAQLPILHDQIEAIIASGVAGTFVLESADKLRRISNHFRCHWNLEKYAAPRCNAPWVSAVVESDGSVRPCFFHAAIGNLRGGNDLVNVLNGPGALEFRSSLDVATNPTCRSCVCSLNWQG